MGEITVPALRDISLEINSGEYIAILGPSGSGKSTLMNILGCLDTPSAGDYFLCNDNVAGLSINQLAKIRNKKIGFIFQNFNLLGYLSALENVTLPLLYQGIARKKRDTLGQELLAQVNLSHRINHFPGELSGGQRQRVAVARALITNPDIILADEPTGNLDTESGTTVVDLFEDLVAKGKTVIVVTHDPALAKRAHRVITIQDGKLVR